MNYGIIEAEDEGYAALLISVVTGHTVEDSFRLMNGEEIRRNRKWTEEDMRLIDSMRKEGMTWSDISLATGIKTSTVNKAYVRWKEEKA